MSEEWVRVEADDGQGFVYAESGQGPLVVLIHGFPDTPHGWERISERLVAAGFRTVRPWLRGYHPDTIVDGRPYDLVTIGSDPIRLLDALGEREAILVGHDWGSVIAYGAATLHPERVRAIVPIALPHPNLLPRDPATMWAARHFFVLNLPWAERKMRRNDFAYLETLYRRWTPNWRGPARDGCVARAKEAFADQRSLHGALDYYRALSPRLAPELTRASSVPGLVVADTNGIDLEIWERTEAMLGEGSETLVLPGTGHWPHREAEDAFLERLLEFAGRVGAATDA